jgi:4-alpha-glucanotransferase
MRPLDRLAVRLGIEPEFRDASGTLRRPPADVKRRLLAAMGVRAQRSADAEKALAELDRAEWMRPLHAAVVRESRLPAAVPVTLQADTADVRWSVEREGGGKEIGSVGFRDLELLERRDGRERRLLVVDARLPLGYHRLSVETDDAEVATVTLIVAPDRCYVPAALERGGRTWGLAVQLYMLRSEGNWGIGDFTDLKRLAAVAGRLGASVIALNPLHAGFLDTPQHASPYSPSSRLFLNVLYIDVTAVAELADCAAAREVVDSPAFRRDVTACRGAELVDYAGVSKLKLPLLEALFHHFADSAPADRSAEFAAFRTDQGEELERFCLWQALREHFAKRSPEHADWRRWPSAYRNMQSPEVARFAHRHRERIDFLAWLQWIADRQLEEAAVAAREAGLAIGLYRDLAVGADRAGAEAWSDAPLFASGASAGAPADLFNPAGQDWGLPPFDPHALRRHGYSTFVELIRANMRHAGGLRIDHAIGLKHLYWVPKNHTPADGAYVSYPLDDLAGIIALESRRQRCLVVGEDLGTVPPGFSEEINDRGILSYRILFFEHDEDGRLIAPEDYPPLALAAVGNHDLAPLRGWWEERDIELKQANGLYPDDSTHREQRERRAQDRAHLIDALRAQGIKLPKGFSADSRYDSALSAAVHAFLARTRAALALVQLDDMVEESDLVNLPGSTEGYPNWKRRQSAALEELEATPLVAKLAALMREARSALSET